MFNSDLSDYLGMGIATAVVSPAGNSPASILEFLSDEQRKAFNEWSATQEPGVNGSVNMSAWPGWIEWAESWGPR